MTRRRFDTDQRLLEPLDHSRAMPMTRHIPFRCRETPHSDVLSQDTTATASHRNPVSTVETPPDVCSGGVSRPTSGFGHRNPRYRRYLRVRTNRSCMEPDTGYPARCYACSNILGGSNGKTAPVAR